MGLFGNRNTDDYVSPFDVDEAADYVDPSTVVERESQIDARQHQREERRRKAQKRAEHRKQEHIEQAYYHTGQPPASHQRPNIPPSQPAGTARPTTNPVVNRGEPAQAADQEAAGRQAGRCDPPAGYRHDTQQHVQRPAGPWSGHRPAPIHPFAETGCLQRRRPPHANGIPHPVRRIIADDILPSHSHRCHHGSGGRRDHRGGLGDRRHHGAAQHILRLAAGVVLVVPR